MRHALLSRLIPLAASLLITFLAAEIVFRTFLPQPLQAVQLAPWGFWHIPGICMTHGAEPTYEGRVFSGTEFVTTICYNSLGLRERELPLAKPAGTLRIVLLGDSYGEGMEVEFEDTMGQVLERRLGARIPALPMERTSFATPAVPSVRASSDDWAQTRAIMVALRDEAARDGAPLLVVSPHYKGRELEERRSFLEGAGIAVVDVSEEDAELPRYHFVFDSHWNPAGHARAAEIVERAIVDRGLLGRAGIRRIEVINASMSAFSTCKELQVYRALGRRYEPDLVLLIYTEADRRNVFDSDMCQMDGDGRITVRPREYPPDAVFLRNLRGNIRARSHFITWVTDRIVQLPIFNTLRQEQIPVRDPKGG